LELGLSFVFTNQHAYAVDTEFYNDVDELGQIDWPLLQRRDFKTEDADPGKQLRYQAEALVHREVPLEALLGIGCFTDTVKNRIEALIDESSLKIEVKTTPNWYF
jgi:hypothetical protein